MDVLERLDEILFGPSVRLGSVDMHPDDYAHLRRFGRGRLSVVTDPDMLREGIVGFLLPPPTMVNAEARTIRVPNRRGQVQGYVSIGIHSFPLVP